MRGPAPPASPEAAEALASLDRRTFLRFAGVVVGAGLLPTGCGGLPAELTPPADRPLAVLTPRGFASFQAFAMRLAGPRVRAGIAAGALDPASAADAWIARQPALGAALGQGLALLEWGLWPLLPKWRPFSALDGRGQDRVLADLAASSWGWKRDLYRGLKSLASVVVYGDPAVRRLLDFPAPFDAEGVRRAMAPFDGS